MILSKLILLLVNILELYNLIVLVAVLVRLFTSLDVLNRSNRFVATVSLLLDSLTEPAFAKIREYVPTFAGIDLSPAILLIMLEVVKAILLSTL